MTAACLAEKLRAVDGYVDEAERLWQSGHLNKAIPLYDTALVLARETAVPHKIGQLLLGKGFALLHMQGKDRAVAFDCLVASRAIAAKHGTKHQVDFVDQLMAKHGLSSESGTGGQSVQDCYFGVGHGKASSDQPPSARLQITTL